MPETTTERLVALVGLAAAVVLLLIAFSPQTRENVVPVAAPGAPETSAELETPSSTQPAASPIATRTQPPPTAAADTALLVLTAARGDCWLSARRDSAEGPLLYEGTLLSGRSLRLDGARLWLRFGAASNVDVTLNGKRISALPTGTGDIVATAKGIQPAA
jgi:Domain of unknown function (DUF4115)